MLGKAAHRKIFRSLTFQATLWYAGLFGLLSFAVFAVVYLHLISDLGHRIDRRLASSAEEFETLYLSHGVDALQSEFKREAHARGVRRLFFRLISPRGAILAASDLNAWQSIPDRPPTFAKAAPTEIFQTIYPPDHREGVRMLFKRTADGHVLQIGSTLLQNAHLRERYRETFGRALTIMIVCGGILGWLVSRQALSGLNRLRQTVTEIGNGDLGRRVALGHGGQEIEELSFAFNTMLDRIQLLVHELQEVTNGVAHDLRSPLTRIRGMAETALTSKANPPDFEEMAGVVIEESDRLVGIINTMLDIAQTDTGLATIAREPLDLQEILHEAFDLFSPMAENKSLIFTMSELPTPLPIIGDRGRLQRVVANLLDNAIKYTPEGGTVSISATCENSQVVVAFRDTGIGIGREDLTSVFEKFYRTDQSRSTPGSGLGLALARSVVRTHGGEIGVASTPGEGSTFTIRLPLAETTGV